MMDSIIANGIVEILESIKCNNIPWVQFRYCNAYTTGYYDICISVNGEDYNVIPIKSYSTIVGFVHMSVLYEIGKYSRTTSKQITRIYNTYFSDCKRVYMARRYSGNDYDFDLSLVKKD